MKALAEQINELDGIEIYGRVVGVRGPDGRGRRPTACDVGRRPGGHRDAGKNIPCEVVGFSGNNALLMPFAPLEGVRRGCRALVTSVAGAVRPSAGWLGRVVNALGEPIDGKGRAAARTLALSVPQYAAARPCPAPGRLAARPRRARAQHLRHLLPRPAHGHFLGLGRRQIGAAVDAGAQRARPTSR